MSISTNRTFQWEQNYRVVLDAETTDLPYNCQKNAIWRHFKNAGNRGFNTISKYKRADLIYMAGYELEIEARKKNINVELGIKNTLKKIKCKNMTVTQGKDGSIEFFKDKFYRSPALTSNVVDRVGAGDAYLSINSLLKRVDCPVEIAQLLSNIAGSTMVSQIGNKRLLEKKNFIKSVISLLK